MLQRRGRDEREFHGAGFDKGWWWVNGAIVSPVYVVLCIRGHCQSLESTMINASLVNGRKIMYPIDLHFTTSSSYHLRNQSLDKISNLRSDQMRMN